MPHENGLIELSKWVLHEFSMRYLLSMQTIDILRVQSDLAFAELVTSLEGVTEPKAWAVLPQSGEDYLHSDGSIQGIVLHIASCKIMYGSTGFRGTEVRWRDCAERVASFEPSWTAALAYLNEAHKYWMDSWADLTDVESEVLHFRGRLWPAWKIINTVNDHDSYHAGQIAVIRYAGTESSTPPPSSAEDIRQSCGDLPGW